MIIPDSILDSVVCISTKGVDGKKYILGTGFVYSKFHRKLEDKKEKELHIHYLITCKHVIEGYDTVFISFGNSNEEMEIKIRKYEPNAFFYNEFIWFEQESGDLDLAVILINQEIIKEKCTNYGYFLNSFSITQMKEKGIGGGDSIFIIGFPQIFKNHREEEIKVLISRHGTIANINNLFEMKNHEFIIDALVFPGNSGGPVVLNPNLNESLGFEKLEDPILIGVVSAFYSHRERAISEYTDEQKILFEDNSGLVSVFPIDLILEIAEYANDKLKLHIENVAKLIEKIDSEDDLSEYFSNTAKELIKVEISGHLQRITSNNAINLIIEDIDENKEIEDAVFDHFRKNNFEFGIKNLRQLFNYEFIGEYIPKEKSDKILDLLEQWELKIE